MKKLLKKYMGDKSQEADVEWVELGDVIRWWDKRIEGWRYGTVEGIGSIYFHILTAHKLRKVRRDDHLYLMREGVGLRLVGGDK